MVVNKPAIIIYTKDPDPDFLREICAGIEEEGVLYQVSSYVFELNLPRFWQCRNLGANSARAIKKMPFKSLYPAENERYS